MTHDLMPVPTEDQEASVLVAYLRVNHYKFTHIPNEAGGTLDAKRRAVRMKRLGTSKGFPDYVVLINGQTVAIELKRRKGSNTSQEQKDWIEALNNAGVPAIIANGADEAIKFIESWHSTNKVTKQTKEVF